MSEVKRYDMRVSLGGFESYESTCGDYVDYEDYAALEDKCAALAAENAGLNSEAPLGAIENGRAFADRLENYQFECEGGNLNMCSDWQEFRRCFEHLSEWAMHIQTEHPATDAFLVEARAQGGAKALVSLEQNALSGNCTIIPGEVLSAILKVARIRADFDDFDGDRRGIGDCLDEAEQELIVTINKYASKLAAGPIAPNDVREQTAIPPVPVIHTDVAQEIEKLKRKLVECNRYNYCADAVKGVEDACRAAMLQRSEPVTDNTNQQFESLAKSE